MIFGELLGFLSMLSFLLEQLHRDSAGWRASWLAETVILDFP